jgi:hypothetical protein
MTALEKVLVRLARTLSDNSLPYMIIGGMANAVWGEPRATLDVDATIWVSDDEIDSTVELLKKIFRPLVSDPSAFIQDTRVLPLESEENIRIDLVFGILPYERDAIDRAVAVEVGGFPVRFCAAEDLILHKIISDREMDIADARGVTLRQMERLDLTYLDSLIGELAVSLERPEILSLWEKWKQEAEEVERG